MMTAVIQTDCVIFCAVCLGLVRRGITSVKYIYDKDIVEAIKLTMKSIYYSDENQNIHNINHKITLLHDTKHISH